jgi:K+-transporting ATPase ATPase C chain
MFRQSVVALKVMILMIVVLGVAYPLLMTGVAQVAFPAQANGSLISVGGKTVGSSLIGQSFDAPQYFQPRPSAAGSGYDPMSSSGSNLGPTSQTLIDAVKARVATATLENPGLQAGQVPVDMVTASGSGLDPHISVANALAQVGRVAKARGMTEASVRDLVGQHTEGRLLGFLGEPVVNVLEINIALDGLKG